MRSVKTVPCCTQEWDFCYNPYSVISPVFTCEMASASRSRRTCNIRCFTQLFVVKMIAKPIWAKDVKFAVRCFCLGYL